MARLPLFALAWITAAATHTPVATAASSCSSDGTTPPTAVFERFIHADCETCWADPATPAPGASAVVLDWIVPSAREDDAPMAAAATRDALLRLQALARPQPAATDIATHAVPAPTGWHLRVAHGMPLNDYLGTGIRWRATGPAALARNPPGEFVLLLVETIPAGTEGSPVERQVVRNMLTGPWPHPSRPHGYMESRPMRIPDGAKPDQLHMVGWVQNAQGDILAAARSVCR